MNNLNLPEHWEMQRLGEVADIFKGGTPKRSVEEYFQGDIPWAIPSDITALGTALYIHDTVTHISEEALGKSAARLLPAGTVLLTSRATIGETAIPTVPMATNQGFANFLCKEMLLNTYLAYYLRYIKQRLKDLATGSTFKEITKGTLLNVEIPLPSLPEQRSIAAVLAAIQEAKFARQKEIALERERKAALMDTLFSHGTKGEPRKQTDIGEIPESWEVVRLGSVAEITMGQSPKGDSYNTDGIGEPLINGPAEFGPKHPIPVQWTNKPTKLCKDGDVLFCVRGNTTGRMNIADQRYCIGRGIAAIHEKTQISDTLFIRHLLEYERFSLYRIAIGGGSTFPNISTIHLKNYLVALPPLPEQRAIANVWEAIDNNTTALEREVKHLDELFHATLEELMTGKRSAAPLIAVHLSN